MHRRQRSNTVAAPEDVLINGQSPVRPAKISPLKGRPKSPEHREHLSAARMGKHYGPFSEEHRRRISEALTGLKRPFRQMPESERITRSIAARKRPPPTPEQITKRSETLRTKGVYAGEKNPNWKGGITPIVRLIRAGEAYRLWRLRVFQRDGFMCRKCESSSNIEAHHLTPFSLIISRHAITTLEQALKCPELWDEDNGLTLCSTCHDSEKRKTWNLILGTVN
jgi:hypothetical protein